MRIEALKLTVGVLKGSRNFWLVIACAGAVCGPALAQNPCGLSATSADPLVAFLNQQSLARTDPPCVEYAIEALGALRSPAAVPALIEFLDFPEPISLDEERTRSLVNSSHYLFRYKAVEALFDIGEPALPSLLHVIADPTASPIVLKNAIQSYQSIRRMTRADSAKVLQSTVADRLCPELMKADDQQLVRFLEQAKGTVNPGLSNCVGAAILGLGISGSRTSVNVLTGYLAYEWRPIESNDGIMQDLDPDHPLAYKNQLYPAVTALYLIGSIALPQLQQLLEDSDVSPQVRAKAIETVMLDYAEYQPKGVEVLAAFFDRRSKTTRDGVADFASSALQWCDLDRRSLCQAAALRQPIHPQ